MLNDKIGTTVVEVNLGTVSIAAGGSTTVTKAHGMLSGYTARIVVMGSTTDGRIVSLGGYVNGANIVCQFCNVSTVYACSGTVKMRVLGTKA